MHSSECYYLTNPINYHVHKPQKRTRTTIPLKLFSLSSHVPTTCIISSSIFHHKKLSNKATFNNQ